MALSPSAPPLSNFKLLCFDVFGTLIDEPTGVYKALQPLLSRPSPSHSDRSMRASFELFLRIEASIHQEVPSLQQHDVLVRIYKEMAREWGLPTPLHEEAEKFARSMAVWLPFSDTVAALQQLSTRYRLAVLSNCDRDTFARVLAGPLKDVDFDAVYLAEDIGSYKPDHRNFEYMLGRVQKDFGVKKGEVLVVAHGLGTDHVATKELGIESAWIKRESTDEEEKGYEGRVAYKWRCNTMGAFAREAENEFGQNMTRGPRPGHIPS